MRNINKITRIISILVLVIFVTASVALASSGEGEEHGSPLKTYLFQILNFAILVTVLVKFGRKPLKEFLKKRTETIQKSLEEARKAKELAQKALDEVEARLKSKDKEIEEIIASAVRSGEKERQRLIEEGEKLSRLIIEQAKTNIEYELNEARNSIKSEAAELAMELAEKKIKAKLDENTQKRLLDEAVAKLESKN